MDNQVRVIIAGGRDFNDGDALIAAFDAFMEGIDNDRITVISGGARGADKIGEWIAKQYEVKLEIMKADWEKHGKSAGFIRNSEMAEQGTHLLAAWDGKSRGTNHMIITARNKGLEVMIHGY